MTRIVSRRRTTPEGGYTLLAMVAIFTIMTVGLAAALPYWSKVTQRDKEEELIFRGLQYAEAIRLFQLRFGRAPVELKELIEVKPRCLRQLWKDPMTESGEWGLIMSRQGRKGRGGQNDQQQQRQPGGLTQGISSEDLTAASGLNQRRGRRGENRTVGPIIGVHSTSEESAIKVFAGGKQYSQWRFRADLIPVAQVVPGTLIVPRVTSDWIGRPFRDGLEPMQGKAPSATGNQPGNPKNQPGSKRQKAGRGSKGGG